MVEGHVRTLISWGCKPSADKPRPFFLTFLFPSCLTFLSQCITFIFPFLPQTPPPPRCCLSSRLPTAYLSGSRGGLASLRRCSRTRCGLNELSAECRRAGRDKQDNELHCRKPCFKVLLPFALSAVVWEAFFEGGFFWLIVDVFNSRGLWGGGEGREPPASTGLQNKGFHLLKASTCFKGPITMRLHVRSPWVLLLEIHQVSSHWECHLEGRREGGGGTMCGSTRPAGEICY